jgi:hypothetical protein
MRIVVSGMIAAVPAQGGATWAVLQYVLGLRELGHEVYFIEQVAGDALRPGGVRLSNSDNARYFASIMAAFGLDGRCALIVSKGEETVGLTHAECARVVRDADLLVNLSGLLTRPEFVEPIPVRLYVDLDPAFTQLWQGVEGIDMRFGCHTHFATVGWWIGSPGSDLPDCGVSWIPTLQPIVLGHWPVSSFPVSGPGPDAAWTTVAHWRGYGSVVRGETHYGQKAHSLRRFLDLPKRTDRRFRLALGIHPGESGDLAALSENGWDLVDPLEVAGCPDSYREFVGTSRGEFGIAKSGYVQSRCGWFSDRSVCYLASGRPVVTQDTGLRPLIGSGHGLFFFETMDDVLGALDAVDAGYEQHARAAREVAEAYFDSNRVLPRLLDSVAGAS